MADLVGSLLQSLRIAEGAGIDPEEEMLEILEKQLKVSPELIDALTWFVISFLDPSLTTD